MENNLKKFLKWKTTSKFLKRENENEIFLLYPIQLTLCYTWGVNFRFDNNNKNEKKYNFETFHVVRSNQNNKIWTLKTNTLMVLTLL